VPGKVLFRPEAEADLIAIALFIGEHSPQRAIEFLARLRQRCAMLEQLPHAGRPREELGAGLRSLVERPYIILYRSVDSTAEIVAIVHGARDLPAVLASRIANEAN
jgi:toxin ParE1/3/4